MPRFKWEKTVHSLCNGAGKILLHYFGKAHRVKEKPGAGIVTEADPAAENYLVKQILRKFPESSIITEETGKYPGKSDLLWVIDPLDGTTNYAHGFPWFCVSIAVYQGTQALAGGIYHPILEEFYFAERGLGSFLNGKKIRVSRTAKFSQALLGTGFYYSKKKQLAEEMKIFHHMNELVQAVRRPGSAALDLACVAAGRFDGFWERGLSSWDVAAGLLLVEEAGGTCSNYNGGPTDLFSAEIVASNSRIHEELVKAIRSSKEF